MKRGRSLFFSLVWPSRAQYFITITLKSSEKGRIRHDTVDKYATLCYHRTDVAKNEN